jgi:hypothetical protein
MAITGHACDGWVFWSVLIEETAQKTDTENQAEAEPTQGTIVATNANQVTEPSTETAPSATKTDPKKTGVFLVPNQKGVPEGQIRWFCRDCGKSFIASAVEVPGICPAKHQAK